MSTRLALPVVVPERIGHQVWAEGATKRATSDPVMTLRLAVVAATVAGGLVAGALISRLL